MALSGIHITCAYSALGPTSGQSPPILGKILWSETMASPGTAGSVAGTNALQFIVFEVYSSVDCFVTYGPLASLDADTLSVFVPAEQTYDFVAQPGDAIAWDTA